MKEARKGVGYKAEIEVHTTLFSKVVTSGTKIR